MSWAINNVTAPDSAPSKASTLDGLPEVTQLNIDVFNSGIFWQLRQADSSAGAGWQSATWKDPVFMAPGSRSLYRAGIVGFRFWAATALAQIPVGGSQAQVTVEAIE